MQKYQKLISYTLAGLVLGCAVSSSNTAFAKKDKKKKGAVAAVDSVALKVDTIVAVPQSLVTPGFTKTESGLEYKMLNDATGRKIELGQYIEMHIETRYKDSLLFSSRKMNNNAPVPYQVQQPQFHGDLAEGFTFLSAGDSAIFLIPVDSMVKAGNQLPPLIEAGKNNKLEYTVTIVTARTPEEMQQEMAMRSAQQTLIDSQTLNAYFAEKNIKPLRTASGLYYSIIKKGIGPKPTTGDSVSMNYTGSLLTGKKFDSNVDPEFHHTEPFWFKLNTRQVIRGWDEGIALLNQGTKAMLYIPSAMAYGSQSQGPIPANAPLIFEVEVKKVVKQGGATAKPAAAKKPVSKALPAKATPVKKTTAGTAATPAKK